MPASNAVAKWPPKEVSAEREHPNQRVYWYDSATQIPSKLTGKYLPSAAVVKEFGRLSSGVKAQHLESTTLFINLPAKFYQEYLSIQMSSNPINFPKIGQNKNISVRACMERHPSFATRRGRLHPSHWLELGWVSQQAYIKWLNSSMLFAFSHCNHYTSATRLIDADQERNSKEPSSTFHFKHYSQRELKYNPKRTNIFSVTGYEFRGFREQGRSTIRSTIPAVEQHTQLTMNQILLAAEETDTTDVVLIPFGMGVFIKGQREEPQIRAAMMAGMVESLSAYKGRPVTIHCCGWPDFYTQLASVNNPRIQFIDGAGNDAYTIANSIQDRGDEQGEQEIIPEELKDDYVPRPLKSMLVNAGDNDWTALLDKTKRPGQFFFGHSLYHQTSDEYYALVTNFACHSVQNLISAFGNLFNANKIKKLNCEITAPFESSLSMEQIDQIDELKTKLEKEYNSCWPYPNKDRKINKFKGLELLIKSAETMTIDKAVKAATKAYPDLLLGGVSSRTADLIEELENSADYSLGPV
ncbi:hypothetical protein BN59_02074 [Legionella massiliensis]|uniref:Uncharacterized protein n=1 Tax=Legionella massiliensis TaxID=1034943 RepID=A0A078L170_9GAMM|nr:hypothetical protein [Legionella massiliensis]CDZ77784.1 hypothetical protein BN59_02074 [Legionella massiliensis]CEE13522.1 hypothetical protein BN1094_02074 [Legionella massiliensis]